MGNLPLVVLFVLTWIGDTTNTCEWDVDVNNQTLTLDLEAIAGQRLQCALDGSSSSHPFLRFGADWVLVYTPCSNGYNCSMFHNGTGPHNATMVSQLQTNKTFPTCVPVLPWDSGNTAPIYVFNDNTKKDEYVFEYKNGYKQVSGNCTNGRHLNVTYICDEDIDTFNEKNITCKELPYNVKINDGICKYEMIIHTKLACLSEPDDGGLSTAWKATIWLGIIFGTLFFFYCCIGYIMNATSQHQWFDIMNNIPNANLWCCCCYKGKDYITIQDSNGLINDDRDRFD